MTKDNAGTKEIIEYGLDNIEVDKTILVNLQDLVYIYKVLQEFMRFFHQPLHYQKLSDIISFLGDKNSGGAFEVLTTALYKKSDKMLPIDIQLLFENADLIHPKLLSYYDNKGD